jgi:hypothetical protein
VHQVGHYPELIEVLCEYYGTVVVETLRGSGFKLWWGEIFHTHTDWS